MTNARLLRPLKPFEVPTRADFVDDAQFMAARVRTFTLRRVTVRCNSIRPIRHGIAGYFRFFTVAAVQPEGHEVARLKLEGLYGCALRVAGERNAEPFWTLTVQVSPAEAERLAEVMSTGEIKVCGIGTEPFPPWKWDKAGKRVGPWFFFLQDLFSGILIW
jgi:hypothetical protein